MEKWRLKLGFSGNLVVNSVGRSGGLCQLWSNNIDVNLLMYSQEHIDVKITDTCAVVWRFTGFYGHPDQAQRKHSWTLLCHLACMYDLPWVCMGDFNEIMCDDEKIGGVIKNWRSMTEFREALKDCNLEDMGFIGPNKRDGGASVMERLDRAGQIPCGRGKRFFFKECWIDDDMCKDVVSSTWRTDFSSNGVVNVLWKIDKCGSSLRRWNMEKRMAMRFDINKKREALKEVNKAGQPMSWKYVNLLESELNDVLEIEERYLRQRAKASARKARNRIKGFHDERGIWRDSTDDMKLIAGDVDRVIAGIQPRLIDQISRLLDAQFSGEEVRKAIFEIKPLSAPGCDGLPAVFYQKFWDLAYKLVYVVYKIIAKTITNIFKHVLGDVISETQCPFVPGRLISDNTIVGFECLHRLKRRCGERGSMAIKLDMSKEYDMVEWVFLRGMMRSLGFSEKWIELIMNCVTSLSYSFILNGEVCGEIKPSKGLSLLFSMVNEENYAAVRNIFDDYERASGQMINFSKSVVCVSRSMSVVEGERIASLVGVKLVECHENYLGLPYFSGRSKRKLFANIIDRVWGKIKCSGEKLLSIGGKEILIKAVVQVVPYYAMSLFRIPKSLILEIQRLCVRFWWGGNVHKKKMQWCTWKHLCMPKREGGLGFHNMESSNRALLVKQGWRILKHPNSLAARVLKGCYFRHDNFLGARKNSSASYVWSSLIWGRDLLDKGLRSRVGDGKTVKIYSDRWILRPTEFRILSPPALDMNATVDKLFSPTGGWNIELIYNNFLSDDAKSILRIPIALGTSHDSLL
ncbi:hypothetical protein Dsin_021833 [Dipteronia sinensis]|uniref:Reverse transcriptase domain-containing protein n=1 Tax=Dipteronia sinensis TaxID=43782 RepID=A0AAE0A0A5_9ROSI|nr:hypothetical protein Dsin_021833 [Dipteronia sinensis]